MRFSQGLLSLLIAAAAPFASFGADTPKGQATPAETLTVLPGFKVELLRSALPDEKGKKASGEGSWVAMAIDPKGRLIVSPQQGVSNMLRITLNSSGQVENVEKIEAPVGSAMGLLWANNSLYVSGAGPEGLALYRLRDLDGDDKFEKVETLRKFEGAGGEHGSHALVQGPDKKIYYIHGNFVKVPKDIAPNSAHRNYAEDQLLPRGEDGNGFGVGIKPPGGFIVRMDEDGKNCELFASGMRNTYDFDISPDGEIFGFDSDMEWDWGMPWYRPTRIYHLVSGGDYGFREGSGKYPKWYPDALPPVVDVGIGSPTGVKFGTRSNWPGKYKKALFAMDWSYGRIFAVHLKPEGASYGADVETLLKGKPLNVTDMEFGKDGALYFVTGGRGTQSGLYRVTYTGSGAPEKAASAAENKAAEQRALRHKLEAFHGKQDPHAVDFAWNHLNSPDRFIRYAARIAIEAQPSEGWASRALAETKPEGSLTALLALARTGKARHEKALVERVNKLYAGSAEEAQQLEALRVLELAFIRMGKPDQALAKETVEALNPTYPAKSEALNRELCQLLVYLQAPDVVEKTLALLDAAPTQEEQITYIFHLRNLKTGWTLDQRKKYFAWFNQNFKESQHPTELVRWFKQAGRDYDNGASFPKFLAYFKKDAIASLSDNERGELAPIITAESAPKPKQPAKAPEARSFVKEWKMEDFANVLGVPNKGRSFESGKQAFAASQCITCHRFGNEGGSIGPDLTAVGSRFSRRDILESILEPSKVVSEQYANSTIFLKDGEDVTGRILEETDQKLVVLVNALNNTKIEIKKSDVQKRELSKLSPMPEGLVNVLKKDEVLDLLAYLESGGKETSPLFTSR